MTEPPPTFADFIAGLELYLDPLLCGAAAASALGVLGVYVVLRRIVFVPLAVTHAASLGVTAALYVQAATGVSLLAEPSAASFLFGLLATATLMVRPERLKVTSGALIGLIYAFCGGATVLFGARLTVESHEVGNLIFGTAVAVSRADFYLVLCSAALVLAAHGWLHHGIVCASFDRDSAMVQRLPVRRLNAVLLISIGLMVAISTRTLGALPSFAFSVLPAVAALALVRRFYHAFLLAGFIGALSAVGGYLLAFRWMFPVGACQTVVAATIAAAALLAGRRG